VKAPRLINAVAETGLLFAYPTTWHYLQEFRAMQWRSPDEIRDLSWGRMRAMLAYAAAHSPFYRQKFEGAGIKPEDIREPEDLVAVPITTKDELRETLRVNWPLTDDQAPHERSIVTTTGSTGEPFSFPLDGDANNKRTAMMFRNIEWYGHRLGDRSARLWRTDHNRPILDKLKKEVFGRRIEISTHDDRTPEGSAIDEAKLADWCERIRRYQPKAVDGYVSALTLLARYILENRVQGIHCEAIVTGGEYLSDHARKLLEEAFRCPVFNRYGGSEVGFVAHECGEHPDHKLHVNAEIMWLELVNEGHPASPGDLGEVIITDFSSRATPLIRYRVGDVGVAAPPSIGCPCGRGLPLLDRIEGRINDLFVLPDGRVLVSHIWHKLFRDKDFVREFRLTQRRPDLVQVDVVLDNRHVKAQYCALKRQVSEFLPGCEVVWNEVDAIPFGPAGKLRHSVSEVPVALNQIRTDAIPPNEALMKLKPYQVTSVQEPLFLEDKDSVLKLDWNECTIPPADSVQRRIVEFLRTDRVNWYADANQKEIRNELAAYLDLDASHVRVFGGSDSALDHILRSFIDPSDEILLASPTYDQFRAYAELTSARVRQVVESDPWSADLDEIQRAVSRKTKLLYLANPNNPTGVYRTIQQIEELVERNRSVLVLVDEAYIEFCDAGGSCVQLVRKYSNLIVSRTFSKAFSLAGLRCGYLVSFPQNLEVIDRIRNPREMNTLTLAAAAESLRQADYYRGYAQQVIESRRLLVSGLREQGVTAYDTQTNFILIRVPQPAAAIDFFRAHGVYIRDRAFGPPIEHCLRISLGVPGDSRRILEVVAQMPAAIVGKHEA
jgi:phenylacetate-CoA ligase